MTTKITKPNFERIAAVVVDRSDNKVEVEEKVSRRAKVEAWSKDWNSLSEIQLVDMEKEMSSFMGDKFAKVQVDTPTVFEHDQLVDLMAEMVSIQNIGAMLEARKENIKQMMMSHFGEKLGEDENNAKEEVWELGKAFSREGCGWNDPTIDEKKLREVLSADQFDAITDEVVTHQVNEEKVFQAMANDPTIVAKMQEALVAPTKKKPRFNIRDITEKK